MPYESSTQIHGSPDSYELGVLETAVNALQYELEYTSETCSTMDDALAFGIQKTVVLTDHQKTGRGRHGRNWLDTPGHSILMTLVEPWDLLGDPTPESLVPQQLFALAGSLAVRECIESLVVQVRWPNDLVADTKKLGGVLIETPFPPTDSVYPRLFGIGINVHGKATDTASSTDYGAISVSEVSNEDIDRQTLLLHVLQKWSDIRVDLRSLQNTQTLLYYEKLWREQSMLIDRDIRIDGLGQTRAEVIEGKVLDTPLGGGIVIETPKGLKEIVEFHSETTVRVYE